MCKFLCVCKFSAPLDKYQGMQLLYHMVRECSVLEETTKMFSKVAARLCIPTGNKWEFLLLYILTSIWRGQLSGFWPFSSVGSGIILICISLMTCDHIFSCAFLVICMSSLVRYLLRFFAHFLKCLLSHCWVLRVLCMLWIIVLYQLCLLQIFSPSLWFVSSLSWTLFLKNILSFRDRMG